MENTTTINNTDAISEGRKKYLDSTRRANKKFRTTHREYYNKYQSDYYHSRKDDEEFAKRMRDKAMRSYYKRKSEKDKEKENEEKKEEPQLLPQQ
jgi:hypothetical protein